MTFLSKKNVLLIVPRFYGYEEAIALALKKMGANVFVVYENIEEISYYYRFFYVYLKKYKNIQCESYYRRQVKKINKIDIVIAIRAQSLTEKTIEYLKVKYGNNTKFYLYLWDSVKNSNNVINIQSYFDKISTFDLEDSKKYGWNYRPLFYITDLLKEEKRDIDIFFQGAIHSDRVNVLNSIYEFTKLNSRKLVGSLYSKKLIYYKRKYVNRESSYILAKNENVTFKTTSLKDTYNLYARSKVVVDYTHPDQSGFTMRTIETIGNRCKLITNNKAVLQADFYNSHNIFVYDKFDLNDVPSDFYETDYAELNREIYERYSIEQWIIDVTSEK